MNCLALITNIFTIFILDGDSCDVNSSKSTSKTGQNNYNFYPGIDMPIRFYLEMHTCANPIQESQNVICFTDFQDGDLVSSIDES